MSSNTNISETSPCTNMSVDRPDSGGMPQGPSPGGVPPIQALEDHVKPPDDEKSNVNENNVTINEDFTNDLLGKSLYFCLI